MEMRSSQNSTGTSLQKKKPSGKNWTSISSSLLDKSFWEALWAHLHFSYHPNPGEREMPLCQMMMVVMMQQLFYQVTNIQCLWSWLLRSLMRSDDMHPFIQGNRRLRTVCFFLIWFILWNRKCITFNWSCGEGEGVFSLYKPNSLYKLINVKDANISPLLA